MSRIMLICALCAAFLPPAFAAPTATPKEIAKRTLPCVVMLVMQDDRGQDSSLGSGFFVAENVVATNLHVVADASNGYAKISGTKRKLPLLDVIAVDKSHDLALLKVRSKTAGLAMGDSGKVAVGDAVYAVGNPEGFDGTFSNGLVSGIRHSARGDLLQITAPISHGSSGGPVLNARGEVIGIAVAVVEEGQNLNFAIPSSCLAALMKSHKIAAAKSRGK